jgi:hypothetical protein
MSLKKIFIIIMLIQLPFWAVAQDWHVGGTIGISNYSGDLAEKRVDFRWSGIMAGVFVKRDLNRFLTARAGITFGKIAGADHTNTNPSLIARNLSFETPVLEGHLGLEWNILDLDAKRFTPYIFAGVGLFGFNPKAYTPTGEKVALQKLGTEGQGNPLYPERGKLYSLQQISFPLGLGFKYLFTDRITLGLELGIRPTTTDYIDDVSTTYVDQNTLLAFKGPVAVEMAYRGDEANGKNVPNPQYPVDGAMRGSPKFNDFYLFSGVTLMYRFGTGVGGGWKKTKFSDCPRIR